MPIIYDIKTDDLYLQGMQQGTQQGIEKGMQQGVEKERQKAALEKEKSMIYMLSQGLEISFIMKALSVSKKYILAIQKKQKV